MVNYYVINAITRKRVKESDCEDKATAKQIRDKYNGDSTKYCVTRSETNLKSNKPHGRPRSGSNLNVFSTQI